MSTKETLEGKPYAGIPRILAALSLFAACPVCPAVTIEVSGSPTVAHALPWNEGAPHFNGPARYGATPGRKFTFTFPVRGSRDGLKFRVVDGSLPDGATLGEANGILSGRVEKPGEYAFTVAAENAVGRALRPFVLVIGDNARGQTPLMGWSSWNACGCWLKQQHVADAARLLVERGFAARGYDYVNIDSCWQGLRTGKGTKALQPNPKRFPDMEGLVREIHGLGLKAGIYSTPMVIAWASGVTGNPETVPGYLPGSTAFPLDDKYGRVHWGGLGKVRFERDDAAEWARLGFDYLKYDWPLCDIPHLKAMRYALDATDRDFQVCCTTQCRLSDAEEYPRFAQLIRSGPDTLDNPSKILESCLAPVDRWAGKWGRGCWLDLDMMALGPIALGRGTYPKLPLDKVHANRLTRDEQITHFALWAFLPTTLQLSWDLSLTDDFLYDLVCNEELIAINQDSAGNPSSCERTADGVRIWERTLADGARAWAFANVTNEVRTVVRSVGASYAWRDVIECRDLGDGDTLKVTLPPHATRVLRGVSTH